MAREMLTVSCRFAREVGRTMIATMRLSDRSCRRTGSSVTHLLSSSELSYDVTMDTTEVPFSQLIQRSRETVATLEASPRRRLRLERRDGQDLILESADRAEAEDEALAMTSRLFFSLVKNDEGARAMLLALPDVFPWVRFLPTQGVRQFLVELVETVVASAELGNVAALAPVVAAWRNTAEVYADPELYNALTAPLDGTDYGPVPAPVVP
jgi:hypothetical protein